MIIEAGEIVYPPGGRLGPRTQANVELVVLLSGSLTIWVDDERRSASAPAACVLLPGHVERFAFSAHEPTHHAWIHLDPAGLAPAMLERLERVREPVPASTALTAQVRELLALRLSRLPTRQELRNLAALQALYHALGEAELAGGAAVRGPSAPVTRVQELVEARLAEPLDVMALAAAASVSRAHLARLFDRELGTTPMAYLWQRRVARGLRLLEDTGLPVGDVAERCGFATQQHFARRVRAEVGVGPAAYRTRRWAPPGE